MTARAPGFALEERLATHGITDLDRPAADVEASSDERDEPVELRWLQVEWGHAGRWNAHADRPTKIVVGQEPAELPPSKVDARDGVPIRAVALRALSGVEPRAGFDVDRAVLTRMILRGTLCCESSADENGERHRAQHCTREPTDSGHAGVFVPEPRVSVHSRAEGCISHGETSGRSVKVNGFLTDGVLFLAIGVSAY